MRRQLRFRDLEYFVAVAEHRSFGQAAESLCVTQPTLSNQIRRIEEALECKAFERDGRSVRVTPEGERMLEHARRILAGFYDLDRAVRGEEDFVGRKLRLGAISTVAPYLGPPLLARLTAENRDGAVSFVEGLTEDLEKRVASGELDCAITATPPRDASLRARRIGEERLVYVSAAALPADPFEEEGAEAARPIILMQEGHCFRDFVYDAIARLNERRLGALNYAISPSSLSTLACLVRSGAGDALLPEPFLAALPSLVEGLERRALPDRRFRRGVQLIMRASREGHVDMDRLAGLAAQAHAAAVGSPKADAA